jgi:gamma-glutamyltranspeptidase/glutathione hydrolase
MRILNDRFRRPFLAAAFRTLFRVPLPTLFLAVLTALALPVRLPAQQPVRAAHGMVASAIALASQAGVDVLKRGGNAVDAACATALTLAVTYPVAGNLGGGGFMLIRLADGRTTAIDYREAAPARASRTMYLNAAGNVVHNLSLVGYRASGVPGTVAGLALAQQKYGRLKWRDVVEPARLLAAQGFPVSQAMAQSLRAASPLTQFAESRHVFLKNGDFYKAGDLFQQPELAATLRRLQTEGPREFYEGRTAQLIADDMKANGGLITRDDLKNYKAVEREPLRGTYRGYDILTMPPPSSGGIALLEMFNILEPHDLAQSGVHTTPTDHLLIEAMRRAFADRAEFLGDPDFIHVPVLGLISKPYAAEVAKTIDLQHATPSSQIGHGKPLAYESPQTTHFSVVDAAGNAVSNTYTLNMGYGSGVTVKGAGFLLNDEMDDFTSKPGIPNGFGLIQGETNAIAPRKRPLSSMTPTIVVRDGKLFMVIGSPGGPTIINTVLQVISNVVDHKMNIAQAIAAPRLHHQWLPDRISAETGAVSSNVLKELQGMGHVFAADVSKSGVYWGDAEGILVESTTAALLGASDPRSHDAAATGY